MFFVRKDNIGTQLGTQKEFAAAERRGIKFFSSPSTTEGHAVWHYLWPSEKIEPSIRRSLLPEVAHDSLVEESEAAQSEPRHFIWSQEVAKGETIGEPVITPYNGQLDRDDYDADTLWTEQAKASWLAAAESLPFPA